MFGRAQTLFAQLQTQQQVLALIGQNEDSWLDVKNWGERDDDSQKMLAKALCGFTNADGGVLVIGMDAKASSNDEPDVITGPRPVANTSIVKSKILDWASKFVEPSIAGIDVHEISDETPESRSGFVVIYVPKSEGSPRRSRRDWRFYTRMGSSTLAMEYWQIEDFFGKGPNPRLTLHLEPTPDFFGAPANKWSA
jgi:predicted HTH transcriptional regulator